MKKNVKKIFVRLCLNNNLSKSEQKEIFSYIKKIMYHKEFQKRSTVMFLHHGNTTLGEHILEDTVLTYKQCKKSNKKIDLELALKIAMMHDLYTLPWQNSVIKKEKKTHLHGFSHPIEAAINSMVWFKNEFSDERKALVLLEGIVHHMYPLPVLSFYESETNELELNNFDMIKKISKENLDLLKKVSTPNITNELSFRISKYLEGRIMSKVDKKVSLGQFNNLSGILALVTGKNKSILQ